MWQLYREETKMKIMETPDRSENSGQQPNELPEIHVVFGGGGTKAVLSGTGAAFAFHVAGAAEFFAKAR